MRAYSCKVRLGGSLHNEIRKVASAAEILVWRYLHGHDAVVDLALWDTEYKRDGEVVKQNEEREYLRMEYDAYLGRERGGRTPTSIDHLFGAYADLPEKLPENIFEEIGEDAMDEEVIRKSREIAKNQTKDHKTDRTKPEKGEPKPAPVEIVDA